MQNKEIIWKNVDTKQTLDFWTRYLNEKLLLSTENYSQSPGQRLDEFEATNFLGLYESKESLVPSNHQSNVLNHGTKNTFEPIPVDDDLKMNFPYSTVGKIIYTHKLGGKTQTFVGSAFMIHTKNEQAVFTAGHCLFSERNINMHRQWAENVVFIPFYDGDKRSLLDLFEANDIYLVNGVGVASQWFHSGLEKKYEYDLGCFTITGGKPNLRDRTGALGWLAGDLDDDDFPLGESIGYTVGEGFDKNSLWKTKVNLSFQNYVTGFPHIRMRGNQFQQGASGGPVIVSNPKDASMIYAIGLNASYSFYDPDFGYWDSPRFGETFRSMIRFLENKEP